MNDKSSDKLDLVWWNNNYMFGRIILGEICMDYPFYTGKVFIGESPIIEMNFKLSNEAMRFVEETVYKLCNQVESTINKPVQGIKNEIKR